MLIACAAAGGLLHMPSLPPVVNALCVGLCGACNRVAWVGGTFVGGAAWALLRAFYIVFVMGRGVGRVLPPCVGSCRRLGVLPGLLRGVVTVSGAGRGSFPVQLRGASPAAFRGLSEGMKKRPGRYASALCLMGLLVKCRRFTFQWSISRRCSSSGITGRLL